SGKLFDADFYNQDTGYWVPNQGDPQDAQEPKEPKEPVHYLGTATPMNIEVLFGRGTGFHNSPGNIMYRQEVAYRLERHSNLTNAGKTQLIRELIEDLWSQGFRFLQRNEDGSWYEVDQPKVLHRKVSACFRTMKKPGNTNTRRRAVSV
ncbi:MAG: hypothetical protein SGBAC_009747, partial [Bacillariaceae sp.]